MTSPHHDQHAGHEPLEEPADPSPVPTTMVGFLGALLLAATMLALTAVYYNAKREEVAVAVLAQPRQEIIELRAQQAALLAGPPRWVERDEQGRSVRALVIPVERAMELVVQEGAR